MLMSSASHVADDEFKDRLKSACDKFNEVFIEWVESKAMELAHRGKRSGNFKYPLAFNDRFNGFRLSTYIKGFRTKEGTFDASRFKELEHGFTDDCSTPFDQVKSILAGRSINIEDISDPTRGLGFWVKISF
jgi:hypothetical protein